MKLTEKPDGLEVSEDGAWLYFDHIDPLSSIGGEALWGIALTGVNSGLLYMLSETCTGNQSTTLPATLSDMCLFEISSMSQRGDDLVISLESNIEGLSGLHHIQSGVVSPFIAELTTARPFRVDVFDRVLLLDSNLGNAALVSTNEETQLGDPAAIAHGQVKYQFDSGPVDTASFGDNSSYPDSPNSWLVLDGSQHLGWRIVW